MSETTPSYILTLSCPDRTGIVAAVTGFLADRDGFITELSHYADQDTRRSFIRTVFHAGSDKLPDLTRLRAQFADVATRFSMDYRIVSAEQKCRVLVMVSKFDHCLNNLLHD